MIRTCFILIILTVFTSCKAEVKEKNDERTVIEDTLSLDVFWHKFQKAVVSGDEEALMEMIEFPLKNAQFGVQRYNDVGLRKDEFSRGKKILFNNHVIEAIKNTRSSDLKIVEKTPKFRMPDIGDIYYIHIITNILDSDGKEKYSSSRILFFGIIGTEYKLYHYEAAG